MLDSLLLKNSEISCSKCSTQELNEKKKPHWILKLLCWDPTTEVTYNF